MFSELELQVILLRRQEEWVFLCYFCHTDHNRDRKLNTKSSEGKVCLRHLFRLNLHAQDRVECPCRVQFLTLPMRGGTAITI